MDKETQKENIEQIAASIKQHTNIEFTEGSSNRAFARAYCTTKSTREGVFEKIFWLVNTQNTRGLQIKKDWTGSGAYACEGTKTTIEKDGQPMYKNTKLGEILIKNYQGTHSYITKTQTKKTNNIKITIHNRSVYSPCHTGAEEIEIRIAGDADCYKFQKLSDLLDIRNQDQEKLREETKKLLTLKKEQERLAAEKASAEQKAKERAEKEEQERIEALRKKKEEEEKSTKLK